MNPEEARQRAEREVHVGVVAAGNSGYTEVEDFLIPPGVPGETRERIARLVHRAGDREAPGSVDLVLYEHGIPRPKSAYSFDAGNPQAAVAQILADNDDLALPLARHFPAFRRPVVERIIHAVSRENALFALATALPDIIPSLVELPWALGEFASDMAFLTGNQIRMAFLIAAASGKDVGFRRRRPRSFRLRRAGSGGGPLRGNWSEKFRSGGLLPKAAVAYAATFAVGKGLEHYHHANVPYTRQQRRSVYQQALERGRAVAGSIGAAAPRL